MIQSEARCDCDIGDGVNCFDWRKQLIKLPIGDMKPLGFDKCGYIFNAKYPFAGVFRDHFTTQTKLYGSTLMWCPRRSMIGIPL